MQLLVALTRGTVAEKGAGVVSEQAGEADRRCLQRVSGAVGRASCAVSAFCVRSVARGLVGSASSHFLHSWQLRRRLGFSFLFLKMQR